MKITTADPVQWQEASEVTRAREALLIAAGYSDVEAQARASGAFDRSLDVRIMLGKE